MPIVKECRKRFSNLRQFAHTGRELLTRTQTWRSLSSKPPSNCDVVVIFGEEENVAKIAWLADILGNRVPELIVTQTYHSRTRTHALYLACSHKNLLKGAQELKMRKRLIEEVGGELQEFCIEDMELFEDVMDEKKFFTSCERQTIVRHYLMSLRAASFESWSDDLSFSIDQSIIPVLLSAGKIQSIFPLHNRETLNVLLHTWVGGFKHHQPIDLVEEYFGMQIALYFAWLSHYTKALIFPAVFGILCWLLLPYDKNAALYYPIVALCTMLWATLFLESWKRTNSSYTYRYGTFDRPSKLLEEPRPQFYGYWEPSAITGRLERFYPRWCRCMTVCLVTVPVVGVCLLFVGLVALGHMRLQEITDRKAQKWPFLLASLVSYLPMILHAICIFVFNEVYYKIARWLTDRENHRLEEDYSNALVAKLILFQFVNIFYASFYIAFCQKDLDLLRQHLITMLVTRQITGNLKEYFLPYGQTRMRQAWLSVRFDRNIGTEHIPLSGKTDESNDSMDDDSVKATSKSSPGLSQECITEDTDVRRRNEGDQLTKQASLVKDVSIPPAEQEQIMPNYYDTSEDYLEMFIQFGFVSMFTCAFPICGLLALLNNILELRGDAWKLVVIFRRPFAQPANGIGVWEHAFDIVSYVAIAVNIGLIGVSGSLELLFPHLRSIDYVLLLIAIEHLFFVLRYGLARMVPPIPSSLERKMATLEHKRREALRTLEREERREAFMRNEQHLAAGSDSVSRT
uniref:Anoctamin n=1 Tax=Schistocephalus solidus TaxID=70667 RepID=A0A0X3QE59_SCHSO